MTCPPKPPVPQAGQQPSYKRGSVIVGWEKPNAGQAVPFGEDIVFYRSVRKRDFIYHIKAICNRYSSCTNILCLPHSVRCHKERCACVSGDFRFETSGHIRATAFPDFRSKSEIFVWDKLIFAKICGLRGTNNTILKNLGEIWG